jgi:hypothetical protein
MSQSLNKNTPKIFRYYSFIHSKIQVKLSILTRFLRDIMAKGKIVTRALTLIIKNLIIVSEQTTIQIKFHESILTMFGDKNIKQLYGL